MHATARTMDFAQALDNKFAGQGNEYASIGGRKYDKIVTVPYGYYGGSSIFAFVDRKTGDLYKPNGRTPAPGVRYTGDELMTRAVADADPDGGFLYAAR